MATPLASPPPPIGTSHGRQVGQVLDELEADRPLARDDPVVVERRDDRQAAFGGDRLGHLPPLLARVADDDDLGAVGRDPFALDRRRVGRHDDDGRGAEQPGGAGDALGVVAR